MHDVRGVADVTVTAGVVVAGVGLLERLDHAADKGAARLADGARQPGAAAGATGEEAAAGAAVELVDDALDEAARACAPALYYALELRRLLRRGDEALGARRRRAPRWRVLGLVRG